MLGNEEGPPIDGRLANLGLAGILGNLMLATKLARRGLISPGDVEELWATINHALEPFGEGDRVFSQTMEDQLEPAFAKLRLIARENWRE